MNASIFLSCTRFSPSSSFTSSSSLHPILCAPSVSTNHFIWQKKVRLLTSIVMTTHNHSDIKRICFLWHKQIRSRALSGSLSQRNHCCIMQSISYHNDDRNCWQTNFYAVLNKYIFWYVSCHKTQSLQQPSIYIWPRYYASVMWLRSLFDLSLFGVMSICKQINWLRIHTAFFWHTKFMFIAYGNWILFFCFRSNSTKLLISAFKIRTVQSSAD